MARQYLWRWIGNSWKHRQKRSRRHFVLKRFAVYLTERRKIRDRQIWSILLEKRLGNKIIGEKKCTVAKVEKSFSDLLWPAERCSICGTRKPVSWMLAVSKHRHLCQCVKSIWAVKPLCMSSSFSNSTVFLLLLHNTFTPHSFVLSYTSDCDLMDMWFTCILLSTSVSFILKSL